MKENWQKIKAWWQHLTTREKQSLLAGSMVTFIFIFYLLVWSPLIIKNVALREQIANNLKTLSFVQAADQEIKKMDQKGSQKTTLTSPVQLLSILQKQINEEGLEQYLAELKQGNLDSIELHVQKIPFDQMISLLIDTIKTYNVNVSQMNVVSEAQPGIVNADIFLQLV